MCLTDTTQILEHVQTQFREQLNDAGYDVADDSVPVHVCVFERGEVLVNQQGTGSLQ